MNLNCDTEAFYKIFRLNHRIKIVQGGSSASKTYSILQLLAGQAINSHQKKIVSIVTDTYPNLKGGAWQDFKDITDGIIPHPKNISDIQLFDWTFQFIALDKPSKALGGRRDTLFLNEANRMEWEIARQLIIRTRESVWIDYNPDRRFWAHEHYIEKERCASVVLTYKDNEYAPEMAIEQIEAYKESDPEWYKVYGLGLLGDIQGSLFKGLKVFDGAIDGTVITATDPKDTGQDFWCTVVGVLKYGLIYIDQVIYSQSLPEVTLPRLAAMVNELGSGHNYIETNYGGSFLLSDIQSRTKQQVLPIKNMTNKLTRIINEARFIKRFFMFRQDGDMEYQKFMNDVKFFTGDRGQPDDAPDALAMLAVIVQSLFYHEFY